MLPESRGRGALRRGRAESSRWIEPRAQRTRSYNLHVPPDDRDIVQIQHLTHSYGQHVALKDVCLSVSTGEIFGFLGPNGSGKTTLFRILSTLIPPTRGTVRMLRLDVVA